MIRRVAFVLALAIITLAGSGLAYRAIPGVRLKTREISWALGHLQASYDEKMAWKRGIDYRYLQFVRQHTPPDAVILVPTARFISKHSQVMEFPALGNRGWVRYFLYPRILAQGEYTSSHRANVTHAMIVQGWVAPGLEELTGPLPPNAYGLIDLSNGHVELMETQ